MKQVANLAQHEHGSSDVLSLDLNVRLQGVTLKPQS